MNRPMNKQETLQYIKDKLADPAFYNYGLLAHMLREIVISENENLRILVYLLGDPNESCAKSDMQYVIERLERKNDVTTK